MIVFEILGFLLLCWIVLELLGFGLDWLTDNAGEIARVGGALAVVVAGIAFLR